MVVNTSSWHYRYIKFHTHVWQVKNLCQYIRKFMYSVFIDIIATVIPICVVTAFGIPIGDNFIAKYGLHIGHLLHYPFYFLCGLLFILVMTLIVIIAAAIYTLIVEGYKYSSNKMNKKSNSNISPFVQYVKDKHNKMCSTITFKDQ